MSKDNHKRKLHYDINVPLFSATALPSNRRHQARLYQTRLHQLGYHGLAFCHTAYGRLNLEKDDADVTLPWGDIAVPSPSSSLPTATKHDHSFGRKNAVGMTIYRRLNIVVEEVSDVSRILLPPNEASPSTAVADLLQKYDIVSLQPMNEPALQNACELLSSSSSSGMTPSTTPSNNTHHIDLLVLEYATGARGGYGLPYKLRKDYVAKALQAGLTFELCYSTAVLDPKRRQGFLRTLGDFHSSYGGIQKKHTLLNKPQHSKCKRRRVDNFPLLLSSGPRQNFTQGTDEGALALRAPDDVHCLVDHMGRGVGGFADKGGYDDTGEVSKGREKSQTQVVVFSAAERVLARAGDRALGVALAPRPSSKNRRQRSQAGGRTRACVIGTTQAGTNTATRNRIDGGEGEEEGSDDSVRSQDAGSSLVHWLSATLRREADAKDATDGKAHESKTSDQKISIVFPMETQESNAKANDQAREPLSGTTSSACDQQSEASKEDEDDVEDGFIAL